MILTCCRPPMGIILFNISVTKEAIAVGHIAWFPSPSGDYLI